MLAQLNREMLPNASQMPEECNYTDSKTWNSLSLSPVILIHVIVIRYSSTKDN